MTTNAAAAASATAAPSGTRMKRNRKRIRTSMGLALKTLARHARACRGHRARASAFYPGGASPHQVNLLRPVANRNCVVVRRGGEQRKVTESSVVKANSIRPY